MDKKENIKSFWFVGVVAVVLFAIIGLYVADTYKNRETYVKNKEVDGKSVVYSINGEDVFADDLYEALYEANGLTASFTAFQRAVLDAAYETTQDMSDVASSYASYVVSYYDQETILSELNSMGYVNGVEDITQYYIDAQKQELLINDYVSDNWDKVAKDYVEENDPRIIYHILVKVADISENTDEEGNVTYTANPTEEETKKLNDILEALKSESFQDVAYQYSDDGSAQNGGYIGVIGKDTASGYYEVFANKSLELKDDEVSDVITSQAGYHIIWNAGSSKEALLANSDFLTLLENVDPNFGVRAVLEKADELGYVIKDQKLLDTITAQIGE